MTEVMPQAYVRPDSAPAWQRALGLASCGHCQAGHHRSCHGAVRVPVNKRIPAGLLFCYCRECSPQVRCLDCGNQFPEDVNPKTWTCLDSYGCSSRIARRQQENRLWRMIQDCKTSSALRRKEERIRQALVREQTVGEQEDRVASRTPRPTSGSCECCGAPTKGGKFAPGHDARYKSVLKKKADAGDKVAYQTLVERGWIRVA